MITALTSTGPPLLSRIALMTAKSSPARSQTVLSIWAPVSNRKPPPEISGLERHASANMPPQFCQSIPEMLRTGPSSPERSISTALRTCGDRLPWKPTTRRRPVRSRASIKSSGFSLSS